jgi:hypothetical protein
MLENLRKTQPVYIPPRMYILQSIVLLSFKNCVCWGVCLGSNTVRNAGRSGKTNGIVIEAKMRAGRRRKRFRQETGWREPNYAGVSDI